MRNDFINQKDNKDKTILALQKEQIALKIGKQFAHVDRQAFSSEESPFEVPHVSQSVSDSQASGQKRGRRISRRSPGIVDREA